MKHVMALLISIFIAHTAYATPTPTPLKEGVHYSVVSSTATRQPEVIEFFSYLCPNCAAFEPIIDSLRETLPAEIPFKKNPVDFLGRDMGDEMQRAYAVAELLGVEHVLSPAIFDRIYAQRQPPKNRDEVKTVFMENNVSAEMFDGAVDSFAVLGMLARYNRNVDEYKIRGVPAFLVNGKYMVNLGAIKDQVEFNKLVAFLLAKT